jgi:hypothetical protein
MYSAAQTGAEITLKPPVVPHQDVTSYTLYTSTFRGRGGGGLLDRLTTGRALE